MTDQQKVQQHYSNAVCHPRPSGEPGFKIYDGTGANIALSLAWATEAGAWHDAAEALKAYEEGVR